MISSGEASTFTGTTDGIAEGTSNLYFTNARVEGFVNDSITTSNITEGDNLYFTNARSIAALTGGDNITIESNGLIVGQPGYTDGEAFANLQTWFSSIDTDDIPEGTANLYFTNTRAVGSLTGGTGIAIESNGLVIATGDSTPVFDTVETGDLTVTGNLVITGNATTISANILQIDDPLIHLAANNEVSDAVDAGWIAHYSPDAGTTKQHAGVFRKHGSNSFYIFSQYVDEELDSGNLVTNIDTANNTFRLANVHASVFVGELEGNVTGTVSDISNHTTDDLLEGSNLYFTNTRAIGSLTAGAGVVINANGLIQSTGEAGTFTGTTDGIEEGASNLYFTNARVYANVAPLLDALTTDDIEEGSNLYFTNTRAIGALTGGDNITIESNGLIVGQPGYTDEESYANSQIWFSAIDTDNIPQGTSNLYFSNDLAIGALTGGDGITIEANGLLISAAGFTGDTDDVPEGTANLYFTNARAIGAFTAGNTIVLEANGYINTKDVSAYLSYAESQTYTGNGVQTIFTMNNSVASPDTLIVTINGVVKIPTTDYTVDGNQLTFTSPPANSSTIEVRYLNITTSTALEYYMRTYSGDGVANTFAIGAGLAANAVIVFENGIAQVPYADYTVVGANVIFTTPPGSNTSIQIREMPLQGRTFTEIIGNTSNIIEGANLYFTNTRAVGAFTAGDNIVIESNGVISANVVGALAAGENIVLESNGMIISSGGGGGGGDASPLSVSRRSILTSMIFG